GSPPRLPERRPDLVDRAPLPPGDRRHLLRRRRKQEADPARRRSGRGRRAAAGMTAERYNTDHVIPGKPGDALPGKPGDALPGSPSSALPGRRGTGRGASAGRASSIWHPRLPGRKPPMLVRGTGVTVHGQIEDWLSDEIATGRLAP